MSRKLAALGGYGALWLTLATFTTKLIGVLQKIPLQNLAGDAVFGIYNIVYPIYQLMMALAVAGIPTALSYYIAGQNPVKQRQTLHISLVFISSIGAICACIGLMGAPMLASMIGYEEVKNSIRVLAIALLFTPIIAVYRGYYQGINNAKQSSISQMIEQCVRVACMLCILIIGVNIHWSDAKLAAGVMWGSVIGAVVTLLWFWYRQKGVRYERPSYKLMLSEGKQLAHIALPTAIAAIVVPMVSVVDALSIPRLLIEAGDAGAMVMAHFGQYSRIQPLIQLVSMLLGAFVAGFIPGWVSQGKAGYVMPRIAILHRYTFIVGIAATVGLYCLATPINIMLYKDTEGLSAFLLLSWTTLSSCMLAVQAPLLQASGIRRLPIVLLVFAACSKALLNIWFVPRWGIDGAAVAAIISLTIPAIIGSLALIQVNRAYKAKKSTLEALRSFFVTLLALLLMVCSINIIGEVFTYVWPAEWHVRLSQTIVTLLSVMVGAVVFGGIMLLLKGIRKSELQMLKNNDSK